MKDGKKDGMREGKKSGIKKQKQIRADRQTKIYTTLKFIVNNVGSMTLRINCNLFCRDPLFFINKLSVLE